DAEFTPKSFTLHVKTPHVRIKRIEKVEEARSAQKIKISNFGIETHIILERNSLQISSLKLTNKDSVVVGAGFLEGDIENFKFTAQQVRARLNVDLTDMRDLALNFFPKLSIPNVYGLLDTSFHGQQRGTLPWVGEAQLRTKDFKINKFYLGEISSDVVFNDQKVDIKELKVQSKAGEILLEKPTISLVNEHPFEARLVANNVELAQFLLQLGIDAPLHLSLQGAVDCKGVLKPEPTAECTGQAKGSQFRVFDSDTNKTVVALKEFKLDGSTKIDNIGVYPKVVAHVGTSKGDIQGEVLYEKGFVFKYKTDNLHFTNVENIADLGLEGHAALTGQTEGNSDYATIDMEIQSTDLWLSDFAIGNAKSALQYKAGQLYLKKLKGAYLSTQYQGDVTVDIPKKRIRAHITSPVMELNDLQKALVRKAALPFESYGLGSGTIDVEGPLEFTKLSYVVNTQFSQGYVGPESFDKAFFHVKSENGNVNAERVEILKGPGSIRLNGKGFPNGNIDTTIATRNLPLEDIQMVADKGMGLTGVVNADMTMKGYIFKPQIHIAGRASRVAMNEQSLPDSVATMSINSSLLEGKAEVMGGKILTEFKFPLSDDAPFAFKLTTEKYNFVPIFSIISANTRQMGYDTELTANINLSSPRGGYKKASGTIEVSAFRITRNSLSMSISKPIDVRFHEGDVKVESFSIRGDNTQLNATSKSAADGSLVQFSGYVDMGLLGFLTPFLQEIRGLFSFSSQMKFADSGFGLQGNGFIERGYLKVKDFPHPVEQLRADFTFNEKRVNVNTFTGLLAGGKLQAEGNIRYEAYKNFPTNIRLRFEDTTIRVPEGVSSRGSGEATITGSWFPFLMEGTYNVTEGFMDRSFQNEENTSIRRSSLLPKILLQQGFDPVEFSLQTHIQGPYQVRNSLLDSAVTGSLLIRGTPSNPVLLGEIKPVKGGQVFFRDVPFTIITGLVRFDTPQELNPYIYGSAVARVKSREYDVNQTSPGSKSTVQERSRTKDYEVNILIQGRMKNAKINLTSQPPLEDHDIISLLALGVTSQQLERRESGEQAADLGSAILSQNLAIKNKLFDVKISSSGAAEDTNVADQKVTLSRQWSPRTSTSVGRTLRSNVTDAKLKYDLNDNLAAILNWEGRQTSEETTKTTNKANDVLGVGLEYGVEFK
ncbi:MAG: translocation/assembly module TamB domain-containing protein, partial [Bdellovibrionales bacterium]